MQIETTNIRKSNFELLRIVSMFMIVYYHLLLWFVQTYPSLSIYKLLWIPLHIGVICFVLISGYWGIRPSIKGISHLLGMFLIFSLPEIIYGCVNADSFHDIYKSCMFVTKSHYWFVRTYIALYILSPMLNKFNAHSEIKAKWLILFALGFLSLYAGNLAKYQIYEDGKNVINFLFLYQLGHLLSVYQLHWKKIKLWKIILVYVCCNFVVLYLNYHFWETYIGEYLWRLCFPYNSIGLIINATLFFIIFSKLDFQSQVVNSFAKGMFAVYILHGIIPYSKNLQIELVTHLFESTNDITIFLVSLLPITLIVMSVCSAVYFLFTPCWRLIDKEALKFSNKIKL